MRHFLEPVCCQSTQPCTSPIFAKWSMQSKESNSTGNCTSHLTFPELIHLRRKCRNHSYRAPIQSVRCAVLPSLIHFPFFSFLFLPISFLFPSFFLPFSFLFSFLFLPISFLPFSFLFLPISFLPSFFLLISFLFPSFLPSLHFTSLHFTALHFTSGHFTSLHFTSLDFTSLTFLPLPCLPFPSLPFPFFPSFLDSCLSFLSL